MDISQMLSNYEEQLKSLEPSLESIQQIISSLQEQKTNLENILSTVKNDTDTALENKKNDNNWEYVYTFGDYGEKNVEDWKLYNEIEGLGTITFETSGSFTLEGDKTASFNEPDLLIDCDVDGLKDSYLSEVVYVSNTDTTTVSISGDGITENITTVSELVYQYNGKGWDNDSNIQSYIDEFSFTYNHLTNPLDLDGTYGVIPLITQYQNSEQLIQSNINKYNQALDLYSRFA